MNVSWALFGVSGRLPSTLPDPTRTRPDPTNITDPRRCGSNSAGDATDKFMTVAADDEDIADVCQTASARAAARKVSP